MATTLPSFTRTMDNAFIQTWYDIRPDAVDNILLALVLWAAFKQKGCMKTQQGGTILTRNVTYNVPTNQVIGVAKGDILPMGEVETTTMASWNWRYMAAPVQRSLIQDQQNRGKYEIRNYIKQRLMEAQEAVKQVYETDLLRAEDTTEAAHKHPQSVNDIVPAFANRATGTYGGIARSNSWWQPQYLQFVLPKEVNLVSQMRHLYNSCGQNMNYPDLIITDQTLFEMYEDFGVDQSQIIKQGSGGLVDLGFEVMKFKGQDMIWTPNITAGEMLMLNTDFIELVYDPEFWFAMGEWKPIPNQNERVAHIISTCNLISTRLSRQGRLYN